MTKKFRIWDGEKFYYEGCKISQNGDVESPWGSDKCDWVIQQWTGLLDKNGREIYEGDIVSYEAGEPNRNDGSFYKSTAEVEFENGAFWPRPIKQECEDSWYDYELKNIQIIGNIFDLTS